MPNFENKKLEVVNTRKINFLAKNTHHKEDLIKNVLNITLLSDLLINAIVQYKQKFNELDQTPLFLTYLDSLIEKHFINFLSDYEKKLGKTIQQFISDSQEKNLKRNERLNARTAANRELQKFTENLIDFFHLEDTPSNFSHQYNKLLEMLDNISNGYIDYEKISEKSQQNQSLHLKQFKNKKQLDLSENKEAKINDYFFEAINQKFILSEELYDNLLSVIQEEFNTIVNENYVSEDKMKAEIAEIQAPRENLRKTYNQEFQTKKLEKMKEIFLDQITKIVGLLERPKEQRIIISGINDQNREQLSFAKIILEDYVSVYGRAPFCSEDINECYKKNEFLTKKWGKDPSRALLVAMRLNTYVWPLLEKELVELRNSTPRENFYLMIEKSTFDKLIMTASSEINPKNSSDLKTAVDFLGEFEKSDVAHNKENKIIIYSSTELRAYLDQYKGIYAANHDRILPVEKEILELVVLIYEKITRLYKECEKENEPQEKNKKLLELVDSTLKKNESSKKVVKETSFKESINSGMTQFKAVPQQPTTTNQDKMEIGNSPSLSNSNSNGNT